MKTKDLKKLLQKEANQIPIGNYQQQILSQVQVENMVEEKTPTKKKKLGLWFSSFVAATACVCVVLFAVINSTKPNHPTPPPSTQVSKAKQLLSYEMVALGNVVDSSYESTLQIKRKQEPTNEQIQIVEEIHEYLITGEMMLNKENITIQNQINKDVNYPDYAYQLIVSYQSLTDYTLYYNEQTLFEEDEDEDIDEVASKLEGVMIKNEIPFLIEGKKEVENDEFECELIIYEDATKQNYIKINQETETNENEYAYEFFKDGKCIRELSLELEIENNKKEMSIEIQEGNLEKEFTFEYNLTLNEIRCTYENDTDDIEIKDIIIYIHDEYYLYVFSKLDVEIQMPR